ncbi:MULTISPECIES: hypothetical protein [unclassified Variovorax]|jgi:hypothetical protein|uniref:hypothetical protein n=1 Tax=unclassified Variovorax TaxID=663243 RepID=UPI0008B14B6D|nr:MULTISPECIES: hypothetical protein [unclassified Variovorax]SEK16369.1 hypothetical protein SAMN05518853_12483 [Variovorax sp. OK202]SFE38114.1 hypothetical protein SAMN05444746_1232 [Variovorax sp. OK212]
MAHVPPFPESSEEAASAESLALQACDDVDALHVVWRAYACLEKLIEPQHRSEAEELCPSRTELSTLMGLVNEELRRRIEVADVTVQALRVAVSESDVQ